MADLINIDNTATEVIAALDDYGDFSATMTATEFVGEVNTAFPDADASVSDTATELVEKINDAAESPSTPEPFKFLHYSDPHNAYQSTVKADKMLNDSTDDDYDEDLAFAILTGDNYSRDNYGKNLRDALTAADTGRHLMMLGNHDASDVYSKVHDDMNTALKSYMTEAGVTYGGEGKDYWHKDFTLSNGRKLRIIATDEYEYDDNDGSSTYTSVVRQAQVDWLIARLDELSSGDYFIVATHKMPFHGSASSPKAMRARNNFCSSYLWDWATDGGQEAYSYIVNAYVNGLNASKTITSSGGVKAIVSKDWSGATSRATFICFLCGHVHGDYHGPVPKNDYSNLLVFDIDTCKKLFAKSYDESDISTEMRTAAGCILINKLTIDFAKHQVKIDRIGANDIPARTIDLTDNCDKNDPHYIEGEFEQYPAVTRDTITFDYTTAQVVESEVAQ